MNWPESQLILDFLGIGRFTGGILRWSGTVNYFPPSVPRLFAQSGALAKVTYVRGSSLQDMIGLSNYMDEVSE
jgi:hypothetical protein